MGRGKYRQYTINSRTLYAHSPDEAAKKYREKYVVNTGEILHINKKWYRVIGEAIIEIVKRK